MAKVERERAAPQLERRSGRERRQRVVFPPRRRRRIHWGETVYHQEVYARTLAEHLSPDARWLDLGAGTRLHGWWGWPSPEQLARVVRPLGCDLLPAHLRRHPQLRAGFAACGEQIPLRDASLDLVSANMVLEHLADPLAVFREIARVLRPGGHFIFVTPNRRHWLVGLIARTMTPSMRSVLGRWRAGKPSTSSHLLPGQFGFGHRYVRRRHRLPPRHSGVRQ